MANGYKVRRSTVADCALEVVRIWRERQQAYVKIGNAGQREHIYAAGLLKNLEKELQKRVCCYCSELVTPRGGTSLQPDANNDPPAISTTSHDLPVELL